MRHKLPSINILNDNGTMNENAGKFEGQKRYDARYAILEELTSLGLFVKKENNPACPSGCATSRRDVGIEPLLKPQWWVRMEGLAKPAIDAVRNGDDQNRPESSGEELLPVAREHQRLVPVRAGCGGGRESRLWYVKLAGQPEGPEVLDQWVVAKNETTQGEKAAAKFPARNSPWSKTQTSLILGSLPAFGLLPPLVGQEHRRDLQELFLYLCPLRRMYTRNPCPDGVCLL